MEKTILENKQYVKLGFKKMESTEIVLALNRALASYQIFCHKLQGFSLYKPVKNLYETY